MKNLLLLLSVLLVGKLYSQIIPQDSQLKGTSFIYPDTSLQTNDTVFIWLKAQVYLLVSKCKTCSPVVIEGMEGMEDSEGILEYWIKKPKLVLKPP